MQTTAISPESDMSLPRAMRAQMKRVRELSESQQNPASDDETPPANAEQIEVAEVQSPDPSPAPAEAPQATPENSRHLPPPGDPRNQDPGYWKQRFLVVHGYLEQERRQRTQSEARLNQQVSDLTDQLRVAQAAQPAQRMPVDEIDLSKFFTPEQIEQYGEDQCKALAHVSMQAGRETAQAAIADALKPIQQREEASRAERERAAENAFYDALAAAVPDYAEIDADDGWRKWLSEVDMSTGFIRQDILSNHVKRQDAAGTAAMFVAYRTHTLRPEPNVTPQGSGRRPETPIAQNAPAVGYPTQAEIRDFYKRSSIGKVKDAERAAFEARLKLQPPG